MGNGPSGFWLYVSTHLHGSKGQNHPAQSSNLVKAILLLHLSLASLACFACFLRLVSSLASCIGSMLFKHAFFKGAVVILSLQSPFKHLPLDLHKQ